MSKIRLTRRDLLNVLILTVVGMILMAIGLIAVGNQPEVYNDFIAETVAYFGSNMSGELKVFFTVLFAGVIGLLLLEHWMKKTKTPEKVDNEKIPMIVKIETVLGVANLIYVWITGGLQITVTLAMIATFFNYLVSSKKQKDGLILNIVTFLAFYGAWTAANWVGFKTEASGVLIMLVTMLVDLGILAIDKRKAILNKVLLVLQVVAPLGLLSCVVERYSVGGNIVKIGYPVQVRILFAVVILAMVGYGVFLTVKKWKESAKLETKKVVLLPTILTMYLMFSIGPGAGMILPQDLHHSGENIIAYQQIVGQGQEAYVEYAPVSGLYPMLIGGVLETFGGEMTEYNIAITVFMMVMAGITAWLVTKHLDKDDSLMVLALFAFGTYNRIAWLLMTLLILFLPKLIEKRNLWLKVWILIVMIQGLYYPSFGGATLIGTLPLGIWQVVRMAKDGELKKRLRDWKFYLGWAVCLAPVLACAPLLLRLAKHVALYAKQTTLADGIAVFGQEVPSWFMPYLDSGLLMTVRQSAYYALRYVLPMVAVWILVMVAVKFWKSRKKWSDAILPALMVAGCAIILVVSFTNTMVRQDLGELVSRARCLIIPIVGTVLYIILKKHATDNACRNVLIGVIVGVTLSVGGSTLNNFTSSTKYANVVPDGYVQITAEMKAEYPRLGDGFIHRDNLAILESYGKRAKALLAYDKDLKFLGWGDLGVYYILDIPTVGQPSLYAAKDFATHEEIIDAIKEQKPAIGLYIPNISPEMLMSYYIYNWLYTTDDYVYDDTYEAFLPVELFKKIHGENAVPASKDEAELRTITSGRVASSLGSSINTLQNILDEYEITEQINEGKLDGNKSTYTYKVVLPESIVGDVADMIYVDFDVDGWIHGSGGNSPLSKQNYNSDIQVVIKWGDGEEEYMVSEMGRGDLLIPVGANSKWLTNKHSSFKIEITNVNEPVKINDIKFYQLQKQ